MVQPPLAHHAPPGKPSPLLPHAHALQPVAWPATPSRLIVRLVSILYTVTSASVELVNLIITSTEEVVPPVQPPANPVEPEVSA